MFLIKNEKTRKNWSKKKCKKKCKKSSLKNNNLNCCAKKITSQINNLKN